MTATDPATATAGRTPAGLVAPDVLTGDAAKRASEYAAKAAPFVDAFVNSQPELTRDGKRLLFVSSRDGLPQLYLSDARDPTAPATRLVTTRDRIARPFATEERKAVVFMSDHGGDENWSFFRVGLDGQNLVELTPGAKLHRDPFLLPDGRPSTIFFSARKPSDATSTVYATSATTPGEPRVIYSDPHPSILVDVSPDGKLGLVLQYASLSERRLLRLAMDTGKTDVLYPTEAGLKVRITDAKFGPKPARDAAPRIYFATDGGGEQSLLVCLDAATGKTVAKQALTPATADVDRIAVAKEGGLVAVGLTAGSHSEIRLLDGRTLAPRTDVQLPLGEGTLGDFSEDGKRLVVTWSTPRTPTDVLAIDTSSGKVTALRQEPRTLRSMPAVEASVVDVPAFDGGKIPTNVYLPDKKPTKRPVLVYFHGGPDLNATIRWNPQYAFFLSLGYAIVEPNVRGSTGFGRAFEQADNGARRVDAFKDVETVSRWVAAQPWADKDKLVVMGRSYGGYTTLFALARWPELWRAGIDLYGVIDLPAFLAGTTGALRELLREELGDPAFLATISPSRELDKIVDPTFVYAGANDPRVPRDQSDRLVKSLRDRQVPSEYFVADNEGHSLGRRDNQIAFLGRVARFLEQHLR
ncbi:MAG TPA: prolyl oligopeptidase family serine peptidase [Kofleriaceae bacterium]|nr:prolyl oligopeptidase family serine peptidase [Kofleriaceae bacterium]